MCSNRTHDLILLREQVLASHFVPLQSAVYFSSRFHCFLSEGQGHTSRVSYQLGPSVEVPMDTRRPQHSTNPATLL